MGYRIGLSIDSSDSSSGDSYYSQASHTEHFISWHDDSDLEPPHTLAWDEESQDFSPLEGTLFIPCQNHKTNSLPLLPSQLSPEDGMPADGQEQTRPAYRSRARRRLESQQLPLVPDEEPLRERSPGSTLRFFLVLLAMSMVILSEVRSSSPRYEFRKETIELPMDSQPLKQNLPDLPKFHLPKMETGQSGNAESGPAALRSARRTNFALARAHDHPHPVFGMPPQPLKEAETNPNSKERFHLLEAPSPEMPRTSRPTPWATYIAGLALVGFLAETGWNEYRRSRMVSEEERSR